MTGSDGLCRACLGVLQEKVMQPALEQVIQKKYYTKLAGIPFIQSLMGRDDETRVRESVGFIKLCKLS